MKVASVTVIAMAQGFARGRHVSWNVSVAAAANGVGVLSYSRLGLKLVPQ
jgi:hypothetical protein